MTLKLAQWSEREIAQELNIPKSVVHYVVARDQWVQLPFDVLDSVPPPPSLAQRLERERRIRNLHLQGLSTREIEAESGFKRSTIHRAILRFADPG